MDLRLSEKGIKIKLDFPGKMIFFNFNLSSIRHRMKGLTKYLNTLSKILNLLDYQEACAFFGIEPCIRILLGSLEYKVQGDPYGLFENPDYFSKLKAVQNNNVESSKGYCLANEFLTMLDNQPLIITKTVTDFELMYFETRPKLSNSEIEILLWGNGNLKGLLPRCGNFENWIGSSFCLNFFAKLLKYEYNSLEADNYIAVYEQTNPKIIKQMHLGFYIKQTMSYDNPGLLSLYYYLKNNAFDISDPTELLPEKDAVEEYENWLRNKFKCGYLFKKPATRERRLDSKSTADDEREDLFLLSNKSLSEVKITPALIELSKALASGELEYLLSQLSNYSSWKLIKTRDSILEERPYLLKAYNQGEKMFRLEIHLYSEGIRKTAELLMDPNKHVIWKDIQFTVIYQDVMLEVIQCLYHPKEFGKCIECIMEHEVEELYSLEGECLLIKKFSLDLPKSSLTTLKRQYVNAAVYKISERSDTYGRQYIECQAIWSIGDGYKNLPEYKIYESGVLEEELKLFTLE